MDNLQFDPNGPYAAANAPRQEERGYPTTGQPERTQPRTGDGDAFPNITRLRLDPKAQPPAQPAPLKNETPPLKVEPDPTPNELARVVFVVGFLALAGIAAKRRSPHFTASLLPPMPFGLMIGGITTAFFGRDRALLDARAHAFAKAAPGRQIFTGLLGGLALAALRHYPKSGAMVMGGVSGFLFADAAIHGLIRLGV
jgi:hypothetical protein